MSLKLRIFCLIILTFVGIIGLCLLWREKKLINSSKELVTQKEEEKNQKKEHENENYQFICQNDEAIKYIQRKQWLKAAKTILNKSVDINDKDLGFYQFNYGALAVNLPQNLSNQTQKIIYYKIVNAGHETIRKLLYHQSFSLRNSYQSDYCKNFHCAHEDIEHISNFKLHLDVPKDNEKHYAFTFVRDPIERFIEGFEEIDQHFLLERHSLPIESSKDILSRFGAFLEFILEYGGSERLYREYPFAKLDLIAPMIGVLNVAKRLETDKFRIFNYNNFAIGWRALLNDSGLLRSLPAQEFDLLKKHLPSKIEKRKSTSYILKSFFACAESRYSSSYNCIYANKSFRGESYSNSIHLKVEEYILAVCRIYLIDYICSEIELPQSCQFLLHELNGVYRELNINMLSNN